MSYRKVYEQNFGPIPVDGDGRTFDIHHRDRNRANNEPSNLQALSIADHYALHLEAGEFQAAHAITLRMKVAPEERRRLAMMASRKQVEEGTHHWLGGEMQRRVGRQRVADGKHHFQTDKHSKRMRDQNLAKSAMGTHEFQKPENIKRVQKVNRQLMDSGIHPFVNGAGAINSRERVKDGSHHFLDHDFSIRMSERAADVNGIRVQRVFSDFTSVVFESISDALRETPEATRRYLVRAASRGYEYLGYRWFIIGKGKRSIPLSSEAINELVFDGKVHNRHGNIIEPKAANKLHKNWLILTPAGVEHHFCGTRTDACKQFGISYSAAKDAKGAVIKRGPSKGFQIKVQE